jgi:Protein of unknown function (DUF1648)
VWVGSETVGANVKQHTADIVFVAILAGAAAFVFQTGGTLPDIVTTHFGSSGEADGSMSRAIYVRFMLLFVVLLPLGLNLLVGRVLRLPSTRINIPHREYWLAPERRTETVERLRTHMRLFGLMLAGFLCYVHWRVVQANRLTPPALDSTKFAYGLALFMVALTAWIVVLRRAFRPPRQ